MSNGWTGGQYSLVRFLLGAYVCVHFAMSGAPLLIVGAIAAVFFAIGLFDRIAAVVIWAVLAWVLVRQPVANAALPFASCLLLVHACLPPAPFWSWSARGRIDPRGNWSFPPALFAVAWVLMSSAYAYSGYVRWGSPFALLLLYAPLALFRRVRPWLWLAMLLVQLATLNVPNVLLHLFTFDPAWVPRRWPNVVETVLYDGSCGLCHRSVRFLIAEDAHGTFTFAPLDEGGPKASVEVHTHDGRTLTRSSAVIHLLQRLGGYWRAIGIAFALVPRVVRDAMYDFVARVRYRVFGRTKEACPLIPPDLRSRFVAR